MHIFPSMAELRKPNRHIRHSRKLFLSANSIPILHQPGLISIRLRLHILPIVDHILSRHSRKPNHIDRQRKGRQ